MAGRVAGKVAIIFGAGQTPGDTMGNGRAAAILYAREGAAVACVDRERASAQETCAIIAGEGGRAIALHADVTREADCKAAIDACVAALGPIDILHNNVGASPGDALDVAGLEESAMDRVVALNLKSVMFTAKHVLPAMGARQTGSIVNISSVAAVCSGQPVLYKVTKAALNALTQQLAMHYADHGVRVNAVMPGLMDTPVAIEGLAARLNRPREDVRAARDAQVPLRHRMGTAWDVAQAALFLASDDAAFITGVILPVDGGQSLRVG